MTGLEVALAGAAIKESIGPAKALIAKLGKSQYEKYIVDMCRCFDRHVSLSYDRCKYVKNVLYRDNSVELKTQYVNVLFDKNGVDTSDEQIALRVRGEGRLLVSGTAGAGKTMFMKWLTLELVDNILHHQRIPLFLELRYINDDSLKDGFIRYILENTSAAEGRVQLDRFQTGLELGQFILVLDAVDEVKPGLREKVIEEIRLLLNN